MRNLVDLLHDLDLTDVHDEPYGLPLQELHRLRLLIEYSHPELEVAVRLELPEGQSCGGPQQWESTEMLFARSESGLDFEPPEGQPFGSESVRRLGVALANSRPPDGSVLELVAWHPSEDDFLQRYRGPIQSGVWQIAQAAPFLCTEDLQKALEVVRQGLEEEWVEAPDEETAEAALTSLRRMVGEDWELQRQGLQLRALSGEARPNELVAQEVFRTCADFQNTWEITQSAGQLTAVQNTLQQLAGQYQSFKRKQAGVHLGDLVFKGKTGEFFSGDLCNLVQVTPEDVDEFDQMMAGLGFHPLGDLTSDKLEGAVCRGYGQDGGQAWGVAIADGGGRFVMEFYSQLADGASLTTTSRHGVADLPKKKIFRTAFPQHDLPELWQSHQQALQQRGAARPAEATLAALAASIDEFLVRHR